MQFDLLVHFILKQLLSSVSEPNSRYPLISFDFLSSPFWEIIVNRLITAPIYFRCKSAFRMRGVGDWEELSEAHFISSNG